MSFSGDIDLVGIPGITSSCFIGRRFCNSSQIIRCFSDLSKISDGFSNYLIIISFPINNKFLPEFSKCLSSDTTNSSKPLFVYHFLIRSSSAPCNKRERVAPITIVLFY